MDTKYNRDMGLDMARTQGDLNPAGQGPVDRHPMGQGPGLGGQGHPHGVRTPIKVGYLLGQGTHWGQGA